MDQADSNPDHGISNAAQKQARVVERFAVVLLAVTASAVFILVYRIFEYGWGIVPAIQLVLSIGLALALGLRKRFPKMNVFALSTVTVVIICIFGVVRFGLVAPTLAFLAVLPIVVTVVWGIRSGLITLSATIVSTFAVSRLYTHGGFVPSFDLEAYFYSPSNWISFILISAVSSLLGIFVAGERVNFWKEVSAELIEETKRRKDSDHLRGQAEQWLKSVSETVPGVVFELVLTEDGLNEIRHISSGSYELWGLHEHEIENDMRRFLRLFVPEDLRQLQILLQHSAKTGETWTGKWRTSTVQGKEKWVHGSGRPHVRQDGSTAWHCIALDATNEVRAEEKARAQTEIAQQAERQKGIGQLTAGVAHDFNNILAIIMGNLEILLEDLDQEELRKMIDTCLEATERGSDLTQSMLAFARKAPLEPTILDINDVARSARNWIGRTLPENIDVETSLLEVLWPVKADQSTTVSALLNLILNARDAMPTGGKLTIETANVHIDQDDIDKKDHDLESGRYVMLAVSDTGDGISSEALENIFDPFFTTKGPGQGSGMGLPMVQGFIKQSGGSIQVYSELGVGTTIKLYFHALGAEDLLSEASNIAVS